MLIRILNGTTWAGAAHLGDYPFEEIPQIGHLLAIDDGGDWRCGSVLAIAHRLTSDTDAADVAILIGPLLTGAVDEPLPLALLDALDGRAAPGPAPWGR